MKCSVKRLLAVMLVLLAIMMISYDEYKEKRDVFLEASYIIERETCFIETEGRIESASYYGNEYMTDGDKFILLEGIAQELGITEGLELFAEREGGRETVTLAKTGAYSDTELSVVTIEEKEHIGTYSFAQYIICKINIKNSPESVCYYTDVLKKSLKKIGVADDVTTTLIGYFDGELEAKKCSLLTDTILDSMNADIIAENRTKDLFSVYAYTDSVTTDTSISLGSTKTNINIAINYNENLNQTRLYLATPILNIEY